jgi:hypothetical protein
VGELTMISAKVTVNETMEYRAVQSAYFKSGLTVVTGQRNKPQAIRKIMHHSIAVNKPVKITVALNGHIIVQKATKRNATTPANVNGIFLPSNVIKAANNGM